MKIEEETKALQIRFPIDMYNRLQEYAKKSRRSINSEVIASIEALFSYLERDGIITTPEQDAAWQKYADQLYLANRIIRERPDLLKELDK